MKKQLITLLICSIAFVSCDDDDVVPTPTPNNGVKEGSRFTFLRTDFDGSGTTVTQTTEYTMTFIEDTTINGESWFITEIADPSGTQTTLVKVANEGMFNYINGVPVMDLKFNAGTGDTWTNSAGEIVTVKGVEQSITIVGGTYTNVTYVETSDANSMENKIWYNDEQFLLKHEEYDEHPTQPGQMVIDYRDELKKVEL